jgi:hypothetical protein
MKRMTLGLAAAAILMGASSTASAQVINNICWNVNGFAVKGSLTVAGSASGTTILDFDGFGTSSGVPIKGTLTIPPSGNARFSFLIEAASPSQNAVTHELSLSLSTLNGTGNWRWFDGSATGASTATFVNCATVAELVGGDSASQGLKE